ncbi:MAG: RNA polymerase factor sigma-54 [Sterolibacterium sp.]|jgi:RNA polymerase sigma-54 factor|nr:RNA polymerase factor sigma-54 [Sterolibacterium sp.]
MKQTLQLKLSQHLALTPQLQQALRLLQLSTLELNQEIDQFLQDNPLLERAEADDSRFVSADAALTTPQLPSQNEASTTQTSESDRDSGSASDPEGCHDDPSYSASNAADSDWGNEGRSSPAREANDDDETNFNELQKAEISLREHLGAQLGLMQLSDHDRGMAIFLVEALDEDGYLDQPLEELIDVLIDCLPPDEQTPAEEKRAQLLEELQIALCRLQSLDPPGISARNPSECLALQLNNHPASITRDHALTLVREHLDLLAARDFTRLKRLLGCDDDELRAAQTLIRSLNPRPGAAYAPLDTRYIVPDIIVRKQHGHWLASLNRDAMPRLSINQMYANILQKNRGGENGGLSSQLQEAKWLIKNIKQRFDTILRVAQAIVDRQQAFLDHGEVAMRPLTLREIATTLSLHESTISRVTTQKYLATPRGIFEFKYFFGSHVATDSGGAASSTAIRALIKQLVSAEDSHNPLSDAKITEILGEQGIVVARRTVAKYREGLSIPAVNLRKSL